KVLAKLAGRLLQEGSWGTGGGRGDRAGLDPLRGRLPPPASRGRGLEVRCEFSLRDTPGDATEARRGRRQEQLAERRGDGAIAQPTGHPSLRWSGVQAWRLADSRASPVLHLSMAPPVPLHEESGRREGKRGWVGAGTNSVGAEP